MSADRLSQEGRMEASRKAQNIQRTINTAIGRRFVRCSTPMRFRPGDVSNPDQDVRWGLSCGSSRL